MKKKSTKKKKINKRAKFYKQFFAVMENAEKSLSHQDLNMFQREIIHVALNVYKNMYGSQNLEDYVDMVMTCVTGTQGEYEPD